MRKLHGVIGATALLVFLGGCAGMGVQKARNLDASGSEFDKGLYAGYLNLAESEYSEGDYRDSDVFAMRARTAAAGSAFGPEDLDARKLPGYSRGALAEGRRRLVTALDAGARSKVPGDAAQAQTMFDCWMQEQEEDFQPNDIARCRAGFDKSLAVIEEAVRPMPVAVTPRPPLLKKEPKAFLVFFDFNSAKIPENQRKIIDKAVASLGKKPSKITLTAHADRSGTDGYNQKLSEQRAMAVKAALAERGLTSAKFQSTAYGESRPFVGTPDGKREEQNRVVFVVIEE